MNFGSTTDGTSTGAPAPATPKRFENLSWRNWTPLVAVLLLATAALVTALPTIISERARPLWPWPKTGFALIAAYSLLILLSAGFLARQQRRIFMIHRWGREEVEKRSRRNMSRLCALLNVSTIMERQTDLQGVFDCITKMCVETFDCEQASLMLLDKSAGKLEVRSAFGHPDPTALLGRKRAIGEGVAGWVAAHRRPLLLGSRPDENCPPDLHLASPEITAAMVVPIILRDELVGVINVSARKPAARFVEEDLHALEVFASNAGTCIRHTEQAAWMRQVIRHSNPRTPGTLATPESPCARRGERFLFSPGGEFPSVDMTTTNAASDEGRCRPTICRLQCG